MTLETYCKAIEEYKNKPMSLIEYFGLKYVFLKLLILVVAGYLIYTNAQALGIVSGIMVGYVVGVVIADLRRATMKTKTFELQKQVIDWDKVDDIIKNS